MARVSSIINCLRLVFSGRAAPAEQTFEPIMVVAFLALRCMPDSRNERTLQISLGASNHGTVEDGLLVVKHGFPIDNLGLVPFPQNG